jgi:predicted phage-related endonuclease
VKVIERIESECTRFWNDHVLADVAPPPTTRGDLKLMYPLNNGKWITATPEMMDYLNKVDEVKETIKTMECDQKTIEKEIIQFIADNDGIIDGEKILATFQADKNGTRRLSIKKRK